MADRIHPIRAWPDQARVAFSIAMRLRSGEAGMRRFTQRHDQA
jgi:hypothetical protein